MNYVNVLKMNSPRFPKPSKKINKSISISTQTGFRYKKEKIIIPTKYRKPIINKDNDIHFFMNCKTKECNNKWVITKTNIKKEYCRKCYLKNNNMETCLRCNATKKKNDFLTCFKCYTEIKNSQPKN